MARIDTLANFVTDIAAAIKAKTGKTDPITPADFDTEINSISGGSSKYAPRYISFYGYTGDELTSELQNLSTSNMTSTKYMFRDCNGLKEFNIGDLDMSQITSTNGMFYNCKNLTTINLSGANLSNLTDVDNMFSYCENATSILFDKLGSDNLETINGLFLNCKKLKELDVDKINMTNVTQYQNTFNGCNSLESINLSGWFKKTHYSYMLNYMFQNCTVLTEVIFPDIIPSTSAIGCDCMFSSCKALEEIDLSCLRGSLSTYGMFQYCTVLKKVLIPNITGIGSNNSGMFQSCTSLEYLDIRNVTSLSLSSGTFRDIPATCEIIVNNDDIRNQILGKRSDFTNIKTVAELEVTE